MKIAAIALCIALSSWVAIAEEAPPPAPPRIIDQGSTPRVQPSNPGAPRVEREPAPQPGATTRPEGTLPSGQSPGGTPPAEGRPTDPASPRVPAQQGPVKPMPVQRSGGEQGARPGEIRESLTEARVREIVNAEMKAVFESYGFKPQNPVRRGAPMERAPVGSGDRQPRDLRRANLESNGSDPDASILGDNNTAGDAPTTVGPFGLKEWVINTYAKIDRRKKTDQSPERTAAKFADLYTSLLSLADGLPATADQLRETYHKGKDAILADLRKEEAQESWQELISQLQQKIDDAKKSNKLEGKDFNPEQPVFVKTAIQEVANGFKELAAQLDVSANLAPSYFQSGGSRMRGASRAGGSVVTTTTVGSGNTIAAVWNERMVNHIVHAHNRRSYRIQRIQMRR